MVIMNRVLLTISLDETASETKKAPHPAKDEKDSRVATLFLQQRCYCRSTLRVQVLPDTLRHDNGARPSRTTEFCQFMAWLFFRATPRPIHCCCAYRSLSKLSDSLNALASTTLSVLRL
jgi:hypothetical protein